jgi:hypothetical protein
MSSSSQLPPPPSGATNKVELYLQAMVQNNRQYLFGDQQPDDYTIQTRFIQPLSEVIALQALEVRTAASTTPEFAGGAGGRRKQMPKSEGVPKKKTSQRVKTSCQQQNKKP